MARSRTYKHERPLGHDLVIPEDPTFADAFVWTWLAPFPVAVGVFVVVVFAFLAQHSADDALAQVEQLLDAQVLGG